MKIQNNSKGFTRPKLLLVVGVVGVLVLVVVLVWNRDSVASRLSGTTQKDVAQTANGELIEAGSAQGGDSADGQDATSPGGSSSSKKKSSGSTGSSGTPGSSSSSPGQQTQPGAKKKACPEEWIDNRTQGANGKDQFFFIGGVRKELKDYDVAWITANCPITIQIVY
ncbi:MAG TPA: hypothetical protein PKA02_02875 [Candidatus Saccharibacteria bacterium]|nr:hypothetical protein [Candidatus Saccharibacteria bacterium]